MLGGASAAGVVANAVLQLLAVAIIGRFAIRAGPAVPGWRSLLVAAGIVLAVVALQLAPMPAAVVGQFPGRAEITEGYRLLGVAPGWQSISLDRDATLATALSLLPAFAVGAAALHATGASRDAAVVTLLAMIVIEIALGALQLTGGGRNYFYEITNASSAVGFFANANHMATLLLVGLPYVAAVGGARSSAGRSRRGQPVWLALALFMVIALGVLLNGSIAGLGLLLPAVGGSYLVYRHAIGRPVRGVIVLAIAVIGVLLLAYLVLGPLRAQFLDRSLSNFDPTTRRTSWVVTALAALKFFPVGTGLGTFVPIYQFHEALGRVTDVYVNHAHNDYLEALLELGAVAPILLILFLAWFVRRAAVLWRSEEAGLSQARAGSIAIAIIMLHSIVDYPLRTAAIAAVFALSAGLMAAPEPIIRVTTRSSRRAAGRHFTAEAANP